MNVQDYGIAIRSKAIGLLEGGSTQKIVSQRLSVSERSLRRWWHAHKAGSRLESRPKQGRPKTISRVAKIVISKSVGKRRQSTRRIATRLSNSGITISKSTVHRYLKGTLGLKSYKRPKKPRLTEKMKENRLKFARKTEKWTIEQWKKVLWSDESSFELFSLPNRQNDRVWSKSSRNIEPCLRIKFPPKIQVWGMISFQAVSELHLIPKGQMVNGAYYRDSILAKTCLDAIKRKRKRGSILERSMLPNMSELFFMQDGAPAHTANSTQEWCSKKFPNFWRKAEWPGNSPDLNPIENVWAYMKEKISEMGDANTLKGLEKNLIEAWRSIPPDFLANLICSMPNRVKLVIEKDGDYIGK